MCWKTDDEKRHSYLAFDWHAGDSRIPRYFSALNTLLDMFELFQPKIRSLGMIAHTKEKRSLWGHCEYTQFSVCVFVSREWRDCNVETCGCLIIHYCFWYWCIRAGLLRAGSHTTTTLLSSSQFGTTWNSLKLWSWLSPQKTFPGASTTRQPSVPAIQYIFKGWWCH